MYRLRRTFLSLTVGLLFSLPGSPAFAAANLTPKLQQLRQTGTPQDTVSVMIHFRDQVDTRSFAHRSDRRAARSEMLQTLKSRADNSQKPLHAFLRSQGIDSRGLWIINAMNADVPLALVDTLAEWPGVEILDVTTGVAPPTPIIQSVPSAPAAWNIDATGAPQLWSDSIIGTGVTVAILDSGVNSNHPALIGTFRGGVDDWFDPYGSTTSPSDYLVNDLAHGTAATSIILGDKIFPGTVFEETVGMAPDARWIAARIFPVSGSATNANILAAMQWALDPDGDGDPVDAPDIVNNSWGFESNPNECLDLGFPAATAVLQNAGIHVIYSGGNAGPDPATSVSPANNSVGYGVGSLDSNLIVSRYSSRGPSPCATSIYTPIGQADVFPEMQAPGEDVRVANGTTSIGGAAVVAGTSFSSPHVSGALALLRQAFPYVSGPIENYRLSLEMALLKAADDLGPLGPDNDYGHGMLNVDAAYLRLSGQPSLSPYTPGAPENDAIVDFGNIPPETRAERNLILKNVGGATLNISSIDAAGVVSPFEFVADNCPAVLGVDSSCSVTLAFAPGLFGNFSASLTINSDDPRQPSQVVTLQGIGNSPPPTPVLVSPADGATVSGTTVELTWFQGGDPDGDQLTQTLVYADNNFFFPSTSVNVPVASSAGTMPLAGAGLLAGVVLCFWRRRMLRLLLLLVPLLAMTSCGGGSGDGSVPVVANQSYTVSGLSSGTTYYWQTRVDDGQGGIVESEVRTFTTP